MADLPTALDASELSDAARPHVAERFAALAARGEHEPPGEYNFRHFRTRHLARDARRTLTDRGVRPGEPAPDFELPRVGGGAIRLSALLHGSDGGRPVLLHFGSFS